MRRLTWFLIGGASTIAAGILAGFAYVRLTGLDARVEAPALEAHLAKTVRSLAVPGVVKERANPVPLTREALQDGMAHYADHCANCHANDGSGATEMGRGLYPRPPDMRLPATQNQTDGELFYVIEHGIRFTGMPGWSTGTPAGETASWQLVHFIRHLPRLSDAEREQMIEMNPRSPEEIRLELEEERFLNEGVQ